jgi:hypothetical protein
MNTKISGNSSEKSLFNIIIRNICLTLFFLGIPVMLMSQVTYYVSPSGNDHWQGRSESPVQGDGPLATLQSAIDKVREDFLKTNGRDYRIVLRDGIYPVNKLIEITEKDQFKLSFESYPGEKPVISAGRKIEGWKSGKVNGIACWKVNLPEVKNGDLYFRQLFVNGERAIRPRLPKTGFYEVEDPLLGTTGTPAQQYADAARDRFIFKTGDIKEWKNLQDVNVMVLHYWQEDYLPLKEVNMAKREVVFTAKSYWPFLRSHPAHACGNAWYYADNVFEALSSPGEWYLDKPTGDLYYIPKSGEKIKEAEIFAPLLTQIISVQGKAGEFAGNIHFTGLSFRHSEIVWDAHYGTGNGYGNSGPALLKFSWAKDCSVSECEFTNLGEYAIELPGGSENIYITGNHFTDLGGGAIKMSSVSNIHITDNEIHSGGRVFHSKVAILSGNTVYCRFLHNHISDFYYNGIVCGGGRTSQHEGAPGSYDNLIMKNHIHNIGQGWLSDMGGIYVPGLQPGMIISGNVIHDINSACYGANAIYLDDAAEHIIVEQNLLYNSNNVIVNFKGQENVIRNNILAFGAQSAIRRASANLMEMSIANIYKNIILVNNTDVHRTRNEIPLFKPGFWSDLNVIWNIGENPLTVAQPFYGKAPMVAGWDEWIEKTGNDRHSVIQDPLFKDPLNGDFTLNEASIVFKLGIDPGSFDDVGPRPKKDWELSRIKAAGSKVSTEGHIE